MRILAFTALTLLVFAQLTLAWNPETNIFFCEKTVSDIWGDAAKPCLTEKAAYCGEVRQLLGPEKAELCQASEGAHPAIAPQFVFKDFESQVNLDDCPLAWVRESNRFICEGDGNPAQDAGRSWFNFSASSKNFCTQVRAFCTGASYIAASRYTLNRVTHLEGCFGGAPDDEIQQNIASGAADWTVERQCVFSYDKQFAGVTRKTTQKISFIFDETQVNEVLQILKNEAENIRNPGITQPTLPPTTTQKTTTTLPKATTSSTLPKTTTTAAATSTTSTLAKTTTTMRQTTTQPKTTTTQSPTTTTSPNADVKKTLDEIEGLFEEFDAQNANTTAAKPASQFDSMVIGGLVAIIVLSAATLASVLLKSRAGMETSSNPKVIVPPSVRLRKRRRG